MFRMLEKFNDFAHFPLRLGLAALFGLAGLGKLMDIQGTAGFFGSLGFPMPLFWVWIAIAIEIIGAIFLLLGFVTRFTAIILTGFLCVALIMAYIIAWDPAKLQVFMLHMPILGATIALVLGGPGKWSLDERFFWE